MKNSIFLLLLSLNVFSQKFEVCITNARIVDGTGNPWVYGSVGIKNGKISQINGIKSEDCKTIIDAKNQILSPGFIDVHTHIESSIIDIPTADNFIFDGVTSLITGNCGSSEVNLKKFFDTLQQIGITPNVASLIGHNSVRAYVMKNVFRDPTATEQKRMEELVAKGMEDGAVGLATGLIYIPGTYSKTPEVVALAKVAAQYGGIYASHIRDEAHKVHEAIEEAINIGREAHIPVEISHFKISAKPLFGKSNETIDLVENARKEGIDVNVDQYPYTASSTNMGTMVPSWVWADGDSLVKARLTDGSSRKQIVKEILESLKKDKRKNFDYAVIARYSGDSSFNGKSISQINKEKGGKNNAESEAYLILDLLQNDKAQMVFHKMDEEDVERILRYPLTMIASDAGIYKFGKNMPHPRGYGSNARVLGRYVREKHTIGLEEAIRKMTSLPAQRFGLESRGLIKEGYAADILLFDENTITDKATFAEPHAYSQGFSLVMINGKVVLQNGQINTERPGAILYGKGKLD
ncbi:D-aminoacylase [Lacihabitans sp. LS3-19]|uniref:N-acyl-D-amino-acid deacylase family protein n=1 Tax=Lacihabitans sp. LS3-19 TaxID=2487335 RepID=UPI0020CBA468|nr:D-aminoacylase [Lacihabitans sp. LS3-19]MCP9766622.1 D-aminoacylase [Lacihabitans sp. LS3-19]